MVGGTKDTKKMPTKGRQAADRGKAGGGKAGGKAGGKSGGGKPGGKPGSGDVAVGPDIPAGATPAPFFASGKSISGRSAPAMAPLPADCKMWGDAAVPGPEIAGGVSRQDVRATYHYYAPAYETSSLACADAFWADPGHGKKLLKYPWTAYCLDGKSFSQDTCGKCLRVTNRRTGASVVARAVDNGGCSDVDGTGLDLDPCAFNAIDTDGKGKADGHMRVDVREVDCGADGTIGARPTPPPKQQPRLAGPAPAGTKLATGPRLKKPNGPNTNPLAVAPWFPSAEVTTRV